MTMKDADVCDTQWCIHIATGLLMYYTVVEYPSDLSILLKGGKETN
jgi:hypothetical protein